MTTLDWIMFLGAAIFGGAVSTVIGLILTTRANAKMYAERERHLDERDARREAKARSHD